jgi:phage shock protein PspC (stress-responsive transcriptional regulator)
VNKVTNIEIAGQVFWIDEEAYQVLKSYLLKIKQQLADDDCASEIYYDIELRVAELLFELKPDKKKAITMIQLDAVVEQVGFIDSDESSTEIPRKSYLDQHNKLLGGVCAGLALRLKVPAFVLRLVFITLTAFFGLGIALYMIFWISLDSNSNRNSALAAQGKAQTARQIATVEAPTENPLVQLQRIIFLPVSIIGTLLSVLGAHFQKRHKGYVFLLKNAFAGVLLFAAGLVCAGLYEFNSQQYFYKPVSWLISAAVMYLLVLIFVVYIKEFYLPNPHNKVDRKLKFGALMPVGIIAISVGVLNQSHSELATDVVEKSFPLKTPELVLLFNEADLKEGFSSSVGFSVKTSKSSQNEVKLHITYSSWGKDTKHAELNLQSTQYFYTFEQGTLKFDKYWMLKDGTFNRGQDVDIVIEVPENILLTSSRSLAIDSDDGTYSYATVRRYWNLDASKNYQYASSGQYIHEIGEGYQNKLSENERDVLNEKFCDEYFISDKWGCYSNIRHDISRNSRFDKAFQKDSESIDQIREYLLPDRSLFVSQLAEINDLVNNISIDYPVKSKFQEYIEHLLKVKSAPLAAHQIQSS